MKPLFLLSFFVAAVLCFSSCNRHDSVPHESIFDNEINPPQPDYDFSPELTDEGTRYVAADFALRYAEGGILAQRDEADGRTRYRLVELSTGRMVEFSCRTPGGTGILEDVCLTVDGNDMRIRGAHVHRINSAGAWIEILAPGGMHYVLVMTDV